jgi:hypothetical protein
MTTDVKAESPVQLMIILKPMEFLMNHALTIKLLDIPTVSFALISSNVEIVIMTLTSVSPLINISPGPSLITDL